MTRIRVCGTVDSDLAIQVDLEHKERKRQACRAFKTEPTFSDTFEDLLKIGLARGAGANPKLSQRKMP